jgi:hypothetical protein
MTFLQPLLLFGLPLISLPILIHLINQRRYQSVQWGAMMFLLAANRMSRGYAKLRQYLILLFRTLAIAGLIFAVSRPLAGGWLGRATGGRPDTTIVLFDRSPSMQQQGPGTVISKMEAGRQQLVRTLGTLGSGNWVLIESTTNHAQPIESPEAMLQLTSTDPASTSADLPAMLESARDYIRNNNCGRTEIWICSDLRHNDWNPDSVRWQTLRDALLEFPQSIRIHLLAYPDAASGNVSVEVTNVRRRQTADGAELLVSLKLAREGGSEAKTTIPVRFDIEGARSEVNIEMDGSPFEVKDQRIPIDRKRDRGWGKVSIPADLNPADNEYFFVFGKPQPRKTLIVSNEPQSVAAVLLASTISPDPGFECTAQVITPEKIATANWDETALVVWHAPLPQAEAALAVDSFVQRGGQILFLPPRAPGGGEFMGVKWLDWIQEKSEIPVETWRGDQDILANTQSGAALPVGKLEVRRVCGLSGEVTPLASLKGGKTLLARVPTSRGGVYFCATTADTSDSSLASNGVVLYALVQRILTSGASVLGQTRQLVAGETNSDEPTTWQKITGATDALSTDYQHHAGIYSAGEKLLAVNRASAEDQATILSDVRLAELFKGLDFARVDDQAGSLVGIIQEIWRPFLVIMMIALLVEAALCMPRKPRPAQTPDAGFAAFVQTATAAAASQNGAATQPQTTPAIG